MMAADLRLSESKIADLRLGESKMADLRLGESKMADSPDSSVLSSSRRSLLSLDGRGRGSFIKQENKEKEKEGEDEEDEKEVEERLGRLLGLVTSEPPVIRSCNYFTSFCAYNCKHKLKEVNKTSSSDFASLSTKREKYCVFKKSFYIIFLKFFFYVTQAIRRRAGGERNPQVTAS